MTTDLMQTNAMAVARDVLSGLEQRLASKDLPTILAAYTDDAVLIGDEDEHYTRESIRAYLTVCAEMEPIIRWTWNEIAATAYAPSAIGFAAVATMSFYSPGGELLATPERFRMSCVAVQVDGTWQISQYHGSRPFVR